jgi:hypothetical protein
MAEAVYLLCGAMSIACAAALFRGFRQSRNRLLLWSSLCFAGLAANNVLLFVDVVSLPAVDLSLTRAAVALASVSVLLFGLVWESVR